MSVFSYEFELRGIYKIAVMTITGLVAFWLHRHHFAPLATIMVFGVAGHYCYESHFHYAKGYKPYGKLGGALRKAVNR